MTQHRDFKINNTPVCVWLFGDGFLVRPMASVNLVTVYLKSLQFFLVRPMASVISVVVYMKFVRDFLVRSVAFVNLVIVYI